LIKEGRSREGQHYVFLTEPDVRTAGKTIEDFSTDKQGSMANSGYLAMTETYEIPKTIVIFSAYQHQAESSISGGGP